MISTGLAPLLLATLLLFAALPGLSSVRKLWPRNRTQVVSESAETKNLFKRLPIIETISILVALILFGFGVAIHKDLQMAQSKQAQALTSLDSLTEIHTELKLAWASGATVPLSEEISARLSQADLALSQKVELAIATSSQASDQGLIALTLISDRMTSLRGELDAGLTQIGSHSQRLVLVFFFGVLLATGSIVGLRKFAEQSGKAKEGEGDAAPLIAHAPVGLFGYKEGKCLYVNSVLRSSFEIRVKPDSISDVFPQKTEPSAEELKELFDSAEKDRKPFCTTIKVFAPKGGASYFEARGMPFYDTEGRFRRMNVFVIDISKLFQAKKDIQFKNRELNSKNQLLASALAELESNLESVVKTLVRAVEAKDPYTAGHSERVGQYATWIGEKLGLGPYELRMLELGCLIHDIGKIGIPDDLLLKPESLTDEEYEVIKLHPVHGANMIETVGIFQECLPIVRWHHERLDGSGYPDGLSGAMLPLSVRIATVADIFDAITSNRSYRDGVATDTAMSIIKKEAKNGQLDPVVVKAFEEVIKEKGVISDSDSTAA